MCDKFKDVCHVLNAGSDKLSDVEKIGDKKLFRAKVLNDEKRTELLMVTGKSGSMRGFENLYIQKSLTYCLRRELSEISRKFRKTAVTGDESSASAVCVSYYHWLVLLAWTEMLVGGRERSRGSGRDQVLGRKESQVPVKKGRNVYWSTPQEVRFLN